MNYGTAPRAAPGWLSFVSLIPALILLSGCASEPPIRVITETRTVEKLVEVTKPLPVQLTRPLNYPSALPDQFTLKELVEQLFAAYDVIDQANKDRESAQRLTSPAVAAPETPLPRP